MPYQEVEEEEGMSMKVRGARGRGVVRKEEEDSCTMYILIFRSQYGLIQEGKFCIYIHKYIYCEALYYVNIS